MKKIIAFILGLIMVFSFCACGNTDTTVDPGNTDTSTEKPDDNKKPDTNPDDNKKPDDGNTPTPSQPITMEQLTLNLELDELSDEEFTYSQLIGTDALGRSVLPTAGLNGKYVGIFYFVLLGQSGHSKIIDVNDLMKEHGTAEAGNPLFALPGMTGYGDESPLTAFHYWGEPLYGYYKSTDKWVIRRHMELFMNAGIDFLYLDYTNSTYEYDSAVQALCEVILELMNEGYEHVPTLTFMLPNDAQYNEAKLQNIYNKFYSKSQYNRCWFRADRDMNPNNRPLVVGNFTTVQSTDLKNRLWLKRMQWPSAAADDDRFPWIEWKYENNGMQPNHGGIMNVSVAQHINSWSSTSYIDSLKGGRAYQYRARGWVNGVNAYGTERDNVMKGTNFEWQWENVMKAQDSLKMVTVTGWNEWAAPKVNYSSYKYGVFNDCFNMEFSRDTEMMKGGYADNYYMQLARFARAFKAKTVAGTDNVRLFSQSSAAAAASADGLAAKFVDISGDAVARTDRSVGEAIDYSDNSNRNNIVCTRVGNDGTNLYVAVECKDNVTAPEPTDESWMNVYITTGADNTWEGFNFVVGRKQAGSGASIEKFTGSGSETEIAGSVTVSRNGKTVLYTIPLSALGAAQRTVIGIKATDNLRKFGNTDDLYISGDCAPMGRMSYAYKIA